MRDTQTFQIKLWRGWCKRTRAGTTACFPFKVYGIRSAVEFKLGAEVRVDHFGGLHFWPPSLILHLGKWSIYIGCSLELV